MKPFRAWCCHKTIGETDGAVLVLNGWEFERPVTIRCPQCQARTLWRPVRRREDVAPLPVLCYAERVEA